MAAVLGAVIEYILKMEDVNLMTPESNVEVDCFFYDETSKQQTKTYCLDGEESPTSLQWTIPFGQIFPVKVPVDFNLDSSFPLEIGLSGGETPTLSICWGFKLAFGLDETGGFYLNTLPDDDPKFSVEALLLCRRQNAGCLVLLSQC